MPADDLMPQPDDRRRDARTTGPEAPGALRGQVWLTLQTRQAQQLIRGRASTPEKPAIVGLIGFADRLRLIWQAARQDDPYADWWLIKIHEAIEAARARIHHRQAELDRQLEQSAGLEVSIAASLRPVRVPLQFANPYAYRGARLLADYDRLVCILLTACHVGLLEREASEALLRVCGRSLRSTFTVPAGYRFLGVDRETLRQDTGKRDTARQSMGELPDDVLRGERRAPLVPSPVRFPAAFTEQVSLHPDASAADAPLPEDENRDRAGRGFSLA